MKTQTTRAKLALLGSGEYTPAMLEADGLILEAAGGPRSARVVLVPTALAREPDALRRWNEMGIRHFETLGVRPIILDVNNREGAFDASLLAPLAEADVIYLSGGDPQYLHQTLRETPAWQLVESRFKQGAVVVGASAGAMVLGGYVLNRPAIDMDADPTWEPGLSLAPDIAVLPHFDRFSARFTSVITPTVPECALPVGIDEDTAWLSPDLTGGEKWVAIGRGTVHRLAAPTTGSKIAS